jgi:hypothetical protein
MTSNDFDIKNGIMIWKSANGNTAKQNLENKSIFILNNDNTEIDISGINYSKIDLKDPMLISKLYKLARNLFNNKKYDKIIISGWHALKILQMFGGTYIDNTMTKLKYITVSDFLNIPASQMYDNGTKTIGYFSDNKVIGKLLDNLVDKLNNANLGQLVLRNMVSDNSLNNMTGGYNLNVIKNSILAYGDSLKSYINSDHIAHFPLHDDYTGGAISLQGEYLEKVNTNKSYKVFEELWNNLKTIISKNNKTIDTTTSSNINTNLTNLKKAEEELINDLDSLIVSATLGPNASATVPSQADIQEYIKRYKTVERRQLRIIGALGNLWGYVPQYQVMSKGQPYYITN